MDRLYVSGKVTEEDLIWIRELTIQDTVVTVAVDKLSAIVDHIVPPRLAADLRTIKDLIRVHSDYPGAALRALSLWRQQTGGKISQLLKVFQDKGLNILVGKIQTEFQAQRSSIDYLQPQVPSLKKCWQNSGQTVACLVLLIATLAVFAHNLVSMEHITKSESRTPVLILPWKWWPEEKDLIVSFVNRTSEDGKPFAQNLRRQLLQSAAAAIVARKAAIVGMGGIGKTSIAKWYANEYQNEYDHIIWINSEGASFHQSFSRLGQDLSLGSPNQQIDYIARNIYGKLAHSRCLFVFDNAEDFDSLKMVLPRNKLHHAIITSRNQYWGNPNEFPIPTLRVDVFTHPECILLLSSTILDLKSGRADEMLFLCKELGFLPLAIQVAVAAITKSRSYTIATYLQRIQKDMKVLMDKRQLTDYELSITATLEMSIELLQRESDCGDMCMTVLYVAAYSNPDNIPEDFLLGLDSTNESQVNDAIDILVQFSILSVDTSSQPTLRKRQYGLHRLVQNVVRKWAVDDSTRAIESIELASDYISSNWEHGDDLNPFSLGHHFWFHQKMKFGLECYAAVSIRVQVSENTTRLRTGAQQYIQSESVIFHLYASEILQICSYEVPLHFQKIIEHYFKLIPITFSQEFTILDFQFVQLHVRRCTVDATDPLYELLLSKLSISRKSNHKDFVGTIPETFKFLMLFGVPLAAAIIAYIAVEY